MIVAMWTGHTDRSRPLAMVFCEAVRACGWKMEYVASLMGISPAQLSRQLAGVESLSAWRLAELPEQFQREYDKRRVGMRGGVVLEAPDLSLIRGACALGEKRMASFTTPVELPLRKEQAS